MAGNLASPDLVGVSRAVAGPGGGELGCYLLVGVIGLGAELVFRGGALLGGNRARFGGHAALADNGPYRFQLHLGGGGVGHGA